MKHRNTISNEEWETIDAYLSGEMSEADRMAFAARLDVEPDLQSKVEEAKLLGTGIGEAILSQKLADFHEAVSKPEQKTIRKPIARVVMLAAAAAVVFAIAAIFIFQGNERDRIFAKYFEADPGLPTAMSTTEDYTFNRGMIDYKRGNYQAAIDAWRPLLSKDGGSDTLHYFTGVSFVALKNADSAIHHLQLVLNQPPVIFYNDAQWYLALALIKNDRKAEAVRLLQQTTHPGKEELLSRLK